MGGIKITSEQVLQTPELAHLYEAVLFLENAPPKSLFPKKYETSAISMAVQHAHDLLKANPYISLKETLTTVLSGCEDGLSGDVLLKVTDRTIKKWEKLAKPIAPQVESELQLA